MVNARQVRPRFAAGRFLVWGMCDACVPYTDPGAPNRFTYKRRNVIESMRVARVAVAAEWQNIPRGTKQIRVHPRSVKLKCRADSLCFLFRKLLRRLLGFLPCTRRLAFLSRSRLAQQFLLEKVSERASVCVCVCVCVLTIV